MFIFLYGVRFVFEDFGFWYERFGLFIEVVVLLIKLEYIKWRKWNIIVLFEFNDLFGL